MRRQHHPRAAIRFLKPFLLFGALSSSLVFTSGSAFAYEAQSDYADTEIVSSHQLETPPGRLGTFFSDVRQYFGIHYRFGGTTPAGFDCSGFVQFMFSKVFNMQLPRSSREMASIGMKVARNELRPGDLVFFQNGKNRINHVGIFVGNNTFIHSSLSRGITRTNLSESYYDTRFATGVRVLNLMDDKVGQMLENFGENGNPS
ncbi:MAG: NlpC/P60 family protein [Chlorobiaceae bacterium]|nr:NlpC/P60 family protein [Chlorobiaceae bacterium]